MKRSLDMIILSGVRLGHSTSQVEELQQYLNHVDAKAIILNGSFIEDIPCNKEQVQIIRTLTAMAQEGTRIYYIANNAPLALQAHPEFFHENIYFGNQLTLRLKGKKYLFLNDNFIQDQFDLPSTSISSELFIKKALEKAVHESCDYIVCGHHCKPSMKLTNTHDHRIFYIHSGDWQEHFSSLEYCWGCWTLYQYEEEHYATYPSNEEVVWGSNDFLAVMEETALGAYY